MKLAAAIGVTALALAGAAASQAASPGSYLKQYIGLYHQVAQIVSSDKGNCVKMANDLKAWSARNKGTIDSLNAQGKKLSSTELAMDAMQYESQLISDAQKIGTSVLSCASNAQVAAALAAQARLKKP